MLSTSSISRDGWRKNFCGRNKLESAVFEAADAADISVIAPCLVFAKQNQEKQFEGIWSQAMTQCDPQLASVPREIFAEIKPALANPTAERWRIQEIRVVPAGGLDDGPSDGTAPNCHWQNCETFAIQ